jgi:hypothetical protein
LAFPKAICIAGAALLACEHDDLTARYLGGEKLDVAELTQIESSMREVKEMLPPTPVSVSLTIIGRAEVQTCPQCSHEFPLQTVSETNHPGERIVDTFRRMKAEREALNPTPAKATETAAHASEFGQTPPNAPVKPAVAEPRPFHEVIAKDTRPDAPINGGGSLVWHTGARNGGSAW